MSAREVTRTTDTKITLDYRGFQPDFATLVYRYAEEDEWWLIDTITNAIMVNLPPTTPDEAASISAEARRRAGME